MASALIVASNLVAMASNLIATLYDGGLKGKRPVRNLGAVSDSRPPCESSL